MDILAIIKKHLPEGVELSDEAIKAIAKQITTEQGKEFVPRESYRKKVDKIEELEGQLASAEDAATYKKKYDDMKEKYDTDIAARQQEIDNLKNASAAEKALENKKKILHKKLEAEGANPKLISLLESKFDLDSIEVEGDADIKGWESVCKPIKEQYADVFGKVEQKPAAVSTPPAGGSPGDPEPKDLREALKQKYGN